MENLSELILSITTLIAAVSALVATLRNTRRVEEIYHATNSMKDELVLATRVGAFAEGRKFEKEEGPTGVDQYKEVEGKTKG